MVKVDTYIHIIYTEGGFVLLKSYHVWSVMKSDAFNMKMTNMTCLHYVPPTLQEVSA